MNTVSTFMIGQTMSRFSYLVGLLLAVFTVLLYVHLSTPRQSEDQRHGSGAAFDSFFSRLNDLLQQPQPPSDLQKKNAKAMAAEKAIIEKVKASMLPPAVKPKPLDASKDSKTFFSQFQQDQLVLKMMKKKANGTFFEVGAYDGEHLSNTLHLERALGWKGLLVEPDKKSFEMLKKAGRRSRLLHACLSPNQEAAEMNFDSMGGHNVFAKLASNKSTKVNEIIKITCYPLHTIILAMDVPIIDYLSMDIEGNELKVLKTVPWGRVKVRIMGVEITHIIPEGSEAVRAFLEQKGFVFHKHQGEDYFFYHPDYASELDLS